MDALSGIIQAFEEEDCRAFRTFIQRKKTRSNRKDLQLFELLLLHPDKDSGELIQTLGTPNRNAYHTIRKRLFRHLGDFILTRQTLTDTTAAAEVQSLFTLAQFFFTQRSEELGWRYLMRAENLAEKNELFSLLNTIYLFQLEKVESPHAPDLDQILERRKQNLIKQREEENITEAQAIIKAKLREFRLFGKDFDFEKLVNEVLENSNLGNLTSASARIQYRLFTIMRSAVLARKDYYSFEPFLLSRYEILKEKRGFERKDHEYQLHILYIIIHTLYRNKRFEEALEYLEEMKECMQEYGGVHHRLFFARYSLLLAAVNNFLGRVDESISTLDAALENTQLSREMRMDMTLNLAVYWFEKKEFSQANKMLLNIYHTNGWIDKNMGKEWLLKKELIEMFVHYELEHYEIALNRIRSMERYFGEFFKLGLYKRVRVFIQIIKRIIVDPELPRNPVFFKELEASFDWVGTEREDIQAMAFYAWLKSKIIQRDYYETLIGWINGDEEFLFQDD
ncbi:tetratricopeptide repeat protein [bacterium SCSIO 12741]|nr:tetratricopeptide repeat protein [bacterium SCSIO 12741]